MEAGGVRRWMRVVGLQHWRKGEDRDWSRARVVKIVKGGEVGVGRERSAASGKEGGIGQVPDARSQRHKEKKCHNAWLGTASQ